METASPHPQPEPQPNSGNGTEGSSDLQFANAPNLMTLGRIALVPVVVACLSRRDPFWDWMAVITFAIASITDYFDGYLARKQNLITVYGKLMDPLADKFLVVCTLVMLQELGRVHPIVVMLLICREMAITGLRALASAEGLVIAASGGAKWKTALQMIALPFLMVREGWAGLPFYGIGLTLLYLSLGLSLWSAKDYVVEFFKAAKYRRQRRAEERRARREARAARKQAARAGKEARRALHSPSPTQKDKDPQA